MRAAIVAEPHGIEDGTYLVPLRLLIGLGWLRACAEKVIDPGWRDGTSLETFLSGHVAAGEVAFPWYETLMEQVFLPHATALALVILLGQLLAGVAIAAGSLTNAALLGGLFMNANFLLAGEPNPSTFYIVIQVALLLTHAGAILGLDAGLSKTIRNPLLVAQPLAARRRSQRRAPVLPLGALALVTAVYALAHVTDWSPAGSVDDPAMIVAMLALLTVAWATIAWLRQDANGQRVLRHRDSHVRPRQTVELPRAAGGFRLGPMPTGRSLAILAVAAILVSGAAVGRDALGRSEPPTAQAQVAPVIDATPLTKSPVAETVVATPEAAAPWDVVSDVESPATAPDVALAAQEIAPTAQESPELVAGDTVVVTANGLNVRAGPGLDGDIAVILPRGLRATVVDGPTAADGYTWFQLEANGIRGWSAGEFLTPLAGA